jgi:hypothetical protein
MLIRQRDDYPVGLPGYGLLGDYIPFYFGILSPMLLKIKTGDGGVKKFPQSKIVYICCKLHKIIETCYRWCFTDGHAKDRFSVFYNSVNKLDKLDWDIIQARYWKNTEEDMDRMRRKQAEFLVKEHVPASCIGKIIVYDEEAQNKIQSIFEKSGSNLPVIIDRDNSYYYL